MKSFFFTSLKIRNERIFRTFCERSEGKKIIFNTIKSQSGIKDLVKSEKKIRRRKEKLTDGKIGTRSGVESFIIFHLLCE